MTTPFSAQTPLVSPGTTWCVTLRGTPEHLAQVDEWVWGYPYLQSSQLMVGGPGDTEIVQGLQIVVGEASHVDHFQTWLKDQPWWGEVAIQWEGVATIEPEDWAEAWKSHWHAQSISDQLVIYPSWEPVASDDPHPYRMMLDPGCAFGTGTHGTTRLVLRALEQVAAQQALDQCSVLDVGTGSGILAIYAALLGCRDVRAIDIEAASIAATKANAKLNGVDSVITVSDTPVEELCHTPMDVILANILGPVVAQLLPEFKARLAPGGIILASGIVENHLPQLETAIATAQLTEVNRQQDGDWYVLHLCHKTSL